jgi:O-methyltransferase
METLDKQEHLESVKTKLLELELTLLPIATLNNLETCLRDCIENKIEGDFLETGVWKGGACILAREVAKLYDNTRTIYVADSFEGLPPPNPSIYPVDAGDIHYTLDYLKIGVDQVKSHFELFGELDDKVVFVKGWFKDTMPHLHIDKLAVLRLDGDMYESTIDVLNYQYPKLSVGGYCIIDDFGHRGANQAVMDYRQQHGITDQIYIVDPRPGVYPSAFWKKTV